MNHPSIDCPPSTKSTRALLLAADASAEVAPETARLLADELSRDETWIERQARALHEQAAGYRMPTPAAA